MISRSAISASSDSKTSKRSSKSESEPRSDRTPSGSIPARTSFSGSPPTSTTRVGDSRRPGPVKDEVRLSQESQDPSEQSHSFNALLGGMESNFGANLTESQQEALDARNDSAALDSLDDQFSVYDNPGGGDTDGVVSLDDLRDVASGDYDRDAARQRLLDGGTEEDQIDAELAKLESNATYLLGREELLADLDVGNDSDNDSDNRISRGDLHAQQYRDDFEAIGDGRADSLGSNRTGIPENDYRLPNQDDDFVTSQGEANRTPELAAQQETAIVEGLAEGGEVSFTNSNGDVENLTFVQLGGEGDDVKFELRGEDGHTVKISSELSAEETRIALARLSDYYTEVPEHLRDSVDEISLLQGGKPGKDNVAADFRSDGDKIRFYNGLDNLNESTFDHEFGHGVGYETDGQGEGVRGTFNPFDGDVNPFGGSKGAPEGWEDAIESDGRRLTEYAETNHEEDFAESWSTYLEAREQGSQALDDYREAFPERFEILEEVYGRAA